MGKMKQFLLYGGDFYYPNGGWRDLLGSFDFAADAIAFAENHFSNQLSYWWHVVDITTGKEVAKEDPNLTKPSTHQVKILRF